MINFNINIVPEPQRLIQYMHYLNLAPLQFIHSVYFPFCGATLLNLEADHRYLFGNIIDIKPAFFGRCSRFVFVNYFAS